MRVLLSIAYLGTHFHGWQTQKQGERTVQDTLLRALVKLCGGKIKLTASGRTDAGVHAEDQKAHVDVPDRLTEEVLLRGLNALLPWDVRILRVQRVPPTFHARKDVVEKSYRYRIDCNPIQSPFRYYTHHHLPRPFRVDRLFPLIPLMEGTHDFSAFTPSRHLYRSTLRTLRKVEITWDQGICTMTFTGKGFLRYMVRKLVGGMVEVALGRWHTEAFVERLTNPSKATPAPSAPAKGLTLLRVCYEEEALFLR